MPFRLFCHEAAHFTSPLGKLAIDTREFFCEVIFWQNFTSVWFGYLHVKTKFSSPVSSIAIDRDRHSTYLDGWHSRVTFCSIKIQLSGRKTRPNCVKRINWATIFRLKVTLDVLFSWNDILWNKSIKFKPSTLNYILKDIWAGIAVLK